PWRNTRASLMKRPPLQYSALLYVLIALIALLLTSCSNYPPGSLAAHSSLVQLTAIDLDPNNPQRKEFGRLTLLSAYALRSKDPRFGGLSGLAIAPDGRLYAISDAGYWVSARMALDSEGKLLDLTEWIIEPILSTTGASVRNPLHDAEALARASDGSFLVAFEQVHRIWRYPPPPMTFYSLPSPVSIPAQVSKAPRNRGLEGLAILPDGRLLALTEEFRNSDGSYKGWLIQGERFFEVSYLPSEGFLVTDCAALSNGDVIVLERRYVPLGILTARLTLIQAEKIQPGAILIGEELTKLEYPLEVDNFEGVAAQEDPRGGTIIYIVSDDNYHPLQHTLLLQFRLNQHGK
ncbi:MAG TPA: esterase-like activity of phytase family protein, partial [Terriglobales bacterium]|nr:esterase-like activity of phytase family protein [Terriglobales bacterium]